MKRLKVYKFCVSLLLCFIISGTFLLLGDIVQASSLEEKVIEPQKIKPKEQEIILKQLPEEVEKSNYNLTIKANISEAELLNELENRIKNALLSKTETVDISDLQIDSNKMYRVCNSIPYVSNGIKVMGYRYENDSYISFIKIENKMSIEEIKKHILLVDQKVAEILSQVNDDMSDEMKALIIHDYFIYEYAYDYDNYLADTISDNSYRSGGLFLYGTGVCEAYASGYYYIMNRLGIECYVTSSDEINHAWNIVNIDGSYYHVDCTWDDPVYDKIGIVQHSYFLLSDTAIQKPSYEGGNTHKGWDSTLICNNEKYDEAYWKEISSKIIFHKGKIYYIEEKNRAIYSRDIISGEKNELKDLGKWYVWEGGENKGSFWQYSYSGLFYHNEELYYNTAEEIRKVSLDGKNDTLVYKPDTTNGYVYGSKKNGADIEYVIKQSPSDSSKQEIRESIQNQFIVQVKDILFADREIQLNIDELFILTYALIPQAATSEIIWSSSDENVATVSEEGVVTALKGGYTVITATAKNGNKQAVCKVMVIEKISYEVIFDTQGGSDIEGQIIEEEGKIIEPKPPTREGYTFAGWYKDDSYENIYDFSEPVTGNITLYAKWNANVSNITLDKSEVSLFIGETIELKATIEPEDAFNKTIIWSSSDESVATVSEKGVVTALVEGKVAITVITEDGNKKAICNITVKKKEEESKGMLGDIDNNGEINVNDALIILKISASLVTSTEEQRKIADVDKNGIVNSGDALLILKYAAGLISKF